MRRAVAALLLAALCAPALAQPAEPRPRRPRPTANPSAVIAAELAWVHLAREKGEVAAARQTATADALLFTPQPILAQAWLRNRADPATMAQREPHAVWSSCDGSFAVTRGVWREGGDGGWIATVWQRQPKDAGYKWVLQQGGRLAAPPAPPEMIAARVGECSAAPPAGEAAADRRSGVSTDRTLRWTTSYDPACGRTFRVAVWTGTAMEEVLTLASDPSPAAQRSAQNCA